ncbi:MAG: peptidylprolyl isomerase [Candidatus Woesearchaeota archaeon]|jgi:FKBP-type peptidyl-prolyl cis-trans isomerase 2|nr:peptidylprolyl isomerase [Candidatus Woesearchaeota archaeon]
MTIKAGDKIKVDYTGTLEDGKVFDTSEGKQPLEFEVGSGQLIKGFDSAVIGMEKGQEKEIKLEPKDAYGEHNPDLQKSIPRDKLPINQEPKPGMMIAIGTPDGQQIPSKIIKVEEKEITLDLNHPLAGKTLTFKIKVVDIITS